MVAPTATDFLEDLSKLRHILLGPYVVVVECADHPEHVLTLDIFMPGKGYLDSVALYTDSNFREVLTRKLPEAVGDELQPLLEGVEGLAWLPNDWSFFCRSLAPYARPGSDDLRALDVENVR